MQDSTRRQITWVIIIGLIAILIIFVAYQRTEMERVVRKLRNSPASHCSGYSVGSIIQAIGETKPNSRGEDNYKKDFIKHVSRQSGIKYYVV